MTAVRTVAVETALYDLLGVAPDASEGAFTSKNP